MAYASTYAVDEIGNRFIKIRKDTTDKKVQFKQHYRPKRFMRVQELQRVTADGAITIKDGVAVISKGSACAATLAAPGLEDDGKILTILSESAYAHTVTNSTPGFNAGGSASDVATATAAAGNLLKLVAFQGAWYVISNTNFTLA